MNKIDDNAAPRDLFTLARDLFELFLRIDGTREAPEITMPAVTCISFIFSVAYLLRFVLRRANKRHVGFRPFYERNREKGSEETSVWDIVRTR